MLFKKVYFSSIISIILLAWWLMVLNLYELGGPTISKMSRDIIIIFFAFQFLCFIIFLFKYKPINLLKLKNYHISAAIVQIIYCIWVLIFCLFFFFSKSLDISYKFELLVLIFELLVVRFIEIVYFDKSFNRYNVYFEPKYTGKLSEEKFKYYKGAGVYIPFFLTVFAYYFLFLFISIPLLRINVLEHFIANGLLLIVLNLLISKFALFVIDDAIGNIILIECIVEAMDGSGGAHPSGLYTNEFVNYDLGFKTRLTVEKKNLIFKGKKVYLIMGGISHIILDVIPI